MGLVTPRRPHALSRTVLAGGLALAIAAHPADARAGVVNDVAKAFVLVAVFGLAAVATVEVLTGVATARNYRASQRDEEGSAGWMGVAAVGGLANVGVGGYLFLDGLPGEQASPCPPAADGGPPPAVSARCTEPTRASKGSLIAGTRLVAFGALAIGSVAAAARSGPGPAPAGQAAPQAAPASVGLSLPAITF
jgi:hypothetical protein